MLILKFQPNAKSMNFNHSIEGTMTTSVTTRLANSYVSFNEVILILHSSRLYLGHLGEGICFQTFVYFIIIISFHKMLYYHINLVQSHGCHELHDPQSLNIGKLCDKLVGQFELIIDMFRPCMCGQWVLI